MIILVTIHNFVMMVINAYFKINNKALRLLMYPLMLLLLITHITLIHIPMIVRGFIVIFYLRVRYKTPIRESFDEFMTGIKGTL